MFASAHLNRAESLLQETLGVRRFCGCKSSDPKSSAVSPGVRCYLCVTDIFEVYFKDSKVQAQHKLHFRFHLAEMDIIKWLWFIVTFWGIRFFLLDKLKNPQ